MLDLSTLNPPQREAVLHGDGPLVVFAGAGSGKTRVITYRIARLVLEQDVPAYKVLAVTFTNKAAAEMRHRILALLPRESLANPDAYGRGPWIGTFHSICARLLRRHAEAVKLSPQFVIYDDTDQKALMTRIVRELDLDDRRYAPRELMRYVERQKQQLRKPDQVEVEDAFEEVCARAYAMYEQRLGAANAVDFNDLLVRMVYALQEHQGIRETLQRLWSYILVDEFQDTNLVQLELVRILAAQHRNLCVVGDDDQSIYKWRGADRRNILDFRQSFADAAVIKLEQNYRSSAHILGTAMAVIAKNVDREPKQLFTHNEPGPKVRVVTCYDERDEARAITEAVRALRERYKLAEMAVFYRTHAQSRVLEEELRASKLNYRVVGGQRFYERSEVKDVLAYLRVLVNPADDVSLLRIINVPTRGIGKTTVDKVTELAAQAGKSVWDTLLAASFGALPELPRASAKKLEAFVNLIRDHALRAQGGLGPATLAEQLIADIGYLEALRDADTVEADGRIENVQELIASMREFENEAEEPTVALYLELMALQTNADEIDASEKLTLMTVHAAKGLEFPVVWVAGLEERLFPMTRDAYIAEDDLEEERRLAYVAFTRAEHRLFLSHARARRLHGEALVCLPSRFLKEIPKEHVEPVSRVSGGFGASSVGTRYESAGQVRYGSGAPSGFRHPQERGRPQTPKLTGVKAAPPKRAPGESYIDRTDSDEANEIMHGARVRHAKFGEGSVLAVEPGRPPKVTVKFDQVGVKTLVASFLEPA
jgi:DNA helicase-2/ATP-dependent DNA helicase PcrA